ncbi:hypothetical protein ROTMU0001_1133 [Rothia mucilaginosa ATCC 25296]|nr:hypothetical protein ROTMU0001_1133 [Rothia mucilaginosa ATCC 25296]
MEVPLSWETYMTISNYRIVEKASLEAYNNAEKSGIFKNIEEIATKDRERLGFYFFILSSITGVKDIKEISDMIIDTDYIRRTTGNPNKNDLGVDAYHIKKDGDGYKISLFNFKYKDNYRSKGSLTEDDVNSTVKFINHISSERLAKIEEDPEYEYSSRAIKNIKKLMDGKPVSTIEIYFVSNNNIRANKNIFSGFEEYKVTEMCLEDIVNRITNDPRNTSAVIQVKKDQVIEYETTGEKLGKSCIFIASLFELMRITCTNQAYRLLEGEEGEEVAEINIDDLNKIEMDKSLLEDNVRNYLGRTKYNKDIIDTIRESGDRFFAYNNGITIIADSVNSRANMPSDVSTITLENFQIVNGGQTLNSVYEYIENSEDKTGKKIESLKNSFVLVRAYSVGLAKPEGEKEELEYSLGAEIAKYTNSQNSIKPADLHANDPIQISLHYYLRQFQYNYVRKSGKSESFSGYRDINMELAAQILMAIMRGEPGKASNNKRALFGKDYKSIFHDGLDFKNVKEYIDFYFKVSDYYEEKGVKSVQRKLYTIYVGNKFKVGGLQIKTINYLEDFLDSRVQKYINKKNEEEGKKNEEEVKNGDVGRKINYRVLISKEFKEFLDSEIEAEIDKEKIKIV